jgi:hypothetical protein
MLNTKTLADDNIIYAAALLYNVKIVILRCNGSSNEIGSSDREVNLGYLNLTDESQPDHYVSLIKTSAGTTYFISFN